MNEELFELRVQPVIESNPTAIERNPLAIDERPEA